MTIKPTFKDALKLWAALYGFAALAITAASLPLIAIEGFSFFAVHWLLFINLTWMAVAVVVLLIALIAYVQWRREQQ